jgi:hypothetical protein
VGSTGGAGDCVDRHDSAAARVGGPLAAWAAGFAAYLAGRGYSRSSVKHHLYLMADLSTWLGEQGLAAGDLTRAVADRFWDALCARGSYLVKGASAEPLLSYLRTLGVLASPQADDAADETGIVLRDYERHLRDGRRASEATITSYLRYAAGFLTALDDPPGGPGINGCLQALDGAQVLDVVSRQITGRRLPSLGAMMTGDRAFLRFLEQAGRITRPLAQWSAPGLVETVSLGTQVLS